MPEPRGKQGTVRGLRPQRVQELLAEAVKVLRKRQEESLVETGGLERFDPFSFTRADIRHHFGQADGVTPEQADALVHAFWRVVQPPKGGYGDYTLPDLAEELVLHRNWRMTSGRLQLPDVLQLLELLREARELDPDFTPSAGLEEFERRAKGALRGLKVDPNRRKRV